MLQTPYHDWHAAHGGRIVDFAGWAMPVQYTSITDEHVAVRERAGLFDISHMGRLEFRGPDAVPFLDRLLTNHVAALEPGQIRYSLVCNEQGGVKDDVLVYRLAAGLDGQPTHLLVVNASNREKILGWIEQNRGAFDVSVHDRTAEWSMLALQGPRAGEIFKNYSGEDVGTHKYYTCWIARTPRGAVIASRTGYTGEDGVELMIPGPVARDVWNDLWEAGQSQGLAACGLGCRDTLRLEAAMPLYGHELTEDCDPLTAGLAFAVKLDKGEFIGREPLQKIISAPLSLTRVGIELAGKRIAREGALVFSGERQIGHVTSGTFSPTLQRPIAMAYVETPTAQGAADFQVDIRGKREAASVAPLPFYKRPRH